MEGYQEKTCSYLSRKHFGHHNAASLSNLLSEVHASFKHVDSKSGLILKRWAQCLIVMLEKMEGNIWVGKLRDILMMETYFNQVKKMIFDHRIIKQS